MKMCGFEARGSENSPELRHKDCHGISLPYFSSPTESPSPETPFHGVLEKHCRSNTYEGGWWSMKSGLIVELFLHGRISSYCRMICCKKQHL